ncbi:hypothetical protein WG66_013144 [Moniliophthora roreri]|nr:hypothetical protein WG66_013144 [Moniliophthora roreri]
MQLKCTNETADPGNTQGEDLPIKIDEEIHRHQMYNSKDRNDEQMVKICWALGREFREVGQRVCMVRALRAGASEGVGRRDFPSDLLVTMVSQAQCIVVTLNEMMFSKAI